MRASILLTALAMALAVNADITQQVISDSTQDIVSDTTQQQSETNTVQSNEESTIDEEEKEEIDPIEGCINGIVLVEPQFDQLTSIVYEFNSTNFDQGLDDAVAIAGNISAIVKNLEVATADCCRMPNPLSEEASLRINEKLDLLTPQIKANMKAFTYEKRAFQSIYFATAIIKGHIEILHTNTTATLDCIMAAAPPETTKATKRHFKQIKYAFENTREFFDSE